MSKQILKQFMTSASASPLTNEHSNNTSFAQISQKSKRPSKTGKKQIIFKFPQEDDKTLCLPQTSANIDKMKNKIFDTLRYNLNVDDFTINIEKDLYLRKNIQTDTFKKALKIINGEYKGKKVHTFEEMARLLLILGRLQVRLDDNGQFDKYIEASIAKMMNKKQEMNMNLTQIESLIQILQNKPFVNNGIKDQLNLFLKQNLFRCQPEVLQNPQFCKILEDLLQTNDFIDGKYSVFQQTDQINPVFLNKVIQMAENHFKSGQQESNKKLLKQVIWTIKMRNLDEKMSKPFMFQINKDQGDSVPKDDIYSQIKVIKDYEFDRYNIQLQQVPQQNKDKSRSQNKKPQQKQTSTQKMINDLKKGKRALSQGYVQSSNLNSGANGLQQLVQKKTDTVGQKGANDKFNLANALYKKTNYNKSNERFSKISIEKLGTKKQHFLNRDLPLQTPPQMSNVASRDNFVQVQKEIGQNQISMHKRSKSAHSVDLGKGSNYFSRISKLVSKNGSQERFYPGGLPKSANTSYHNQMLNQNLSTARRRQNQLRHQKIQQNLSNQRKNMFSMFSMKNMIQNYNQIVQQKKHTLLHNAFNVKMRSRSVSYIQPQAKNNQSRSGSLSQMRSQNIMNNKDTHLKKYHSMNKFTNEYIKKIFPHNAKEGFKRSKSRSKSLFVNYNIPTSQNVFSRRHNNARSVHDAAASTAFHTQSRRANSLNFQNQFQSKMKNQSQHIMDKQIKSQTSLKKRYNRYQSQCYQSQCTQKSQQPIINSSYAKKTYLPMKKQNQSQQSKKGTQHTTSRKTSVISLADLQKAVSQPEIILKNCKNLQKSENPEKNNGDFLRHKLGDNSQSTIETQAHDGSNDLTHLYDIKQLEVTHEKFEINFTNLEVDLKFHGPHLQISKMFGPTQSKNLIDILKVDKIPKNENSENNDMIFNRFLSFVDNIKQNPQIDIDLKFYQNVNAQILQSNIVILQIVHTYLRLKNATYNNLPFLDNQNALQIFKLLDNRSAACKDLQKILDTIKFCTLFAVAPIQNQKETNSLAQIFVDKINWTNIDCKCLRNAQSILQSLQAENIKTKNSLMASSDLLQMIINEQIIERQTCSHESLENTVLDSRNLSYQIFEKLTTEEKSQRSRNIQKQQQCQAQEYQPVILQQQELQRQALQSVAPPQQVQKSYTCVLDQDLTNMIQEQMAAKNQNQGQNQDPQAQVHHFRSFNNQIGNQEPQIINLKHNDKHIMDEFHQKMLHKQQLVEKYESMRKIHSKSVSMDFASPRHSRQNLLAIAQDHQYIEDPYQDAEREQRATEEEYIEITQPLSRIQSEIQNCQMISSNPSPSQIIIEDKIKYGQNQEGVVQTDTDQNINIKAFNFNDLESSPSRCKTKDGEDEGPSEQEKEASKQHTQSMIFKDQYVLDSSDHLNNKSSSFGIGQGLATGELELGFGPSDAWLQQNTNHPSIENDCRNSKVRFQDDRLNCSQNVKQLDIGQNISKCDNTMQLDFLKCINKRKHIQSVENSEKKKKLNQNEKFYSFDSSRYVPNIPSLQSDEINQSQFEESQPISVNIKRPIVVKGINFINNHVKNFNKNEKMRRDAITNQNQLDFIKSITNAGGKHQTGNSGTNVMKNQIYQSKEITNSLAAKSKGNNIQQQYRQEKTQNKAKSTTFSKRSKSMGEINQQYLVNQNHGKVRSTTLQNKYEQLQRGQSEFYTFFSKHEEEEPSQQNQKNPVQQIPEGKNERRSSIYQLMFTKSGKPSQTRRHSQNQFDSNQVRDKSSMDLLNERIAMSILNSPNSYGSASNARNLLNRNNLQQFQGDSLLATSQLPLNNNLAGGLSQHSSSNYPTLRPRQGSVVIQSHDQEIAKNIEYAIKLNNEIINYDNKYFNSQQINPRKMQFQAEKAHNHALILNQKVSPPFVPRMKKNKSELPPNSNNDNYLQSFRPHNMMQKEDYSIYNQPNINIYQPSGSTQQQMQHVNGTPQICGASLNQTMYSPQDTGNQQQHLAKQVSTIGRPPGIMASRNRHCPPSSLINELLEASEPMPKQIASQLTTPQDYDTRNPQELPQNENNQRRETYNVQNMTKESCVKNLSALFENSRLNSANTSTNVTGLNFKNCLNQQYSKHSDKLLEGPPFGDTHEQLQLSNVDFRKYPSYIQSQNEQFNDNMMENLNKFLNMSVSKITGSAEQNSFNQMNTNNIKSIIKEAPQSASQSFVKDQEPRSLLNGLDRSRHKSKQTEDVNHMLQFNQKQQNLQQERMSGVSNNTQYLMGVFGLSKGTQSGVSQSQQQQYNMNNQAQQQTSFSRFSKSNSQKLDHFQVGFNPASTQQFQHFNDQDMVNLRHLGAEPQPHLLKSGDSPINTESFTSTQTQKMNSVQIRQIKTYNENKENIQHFA